MKIKRVKQLLELEKEYALKQTGYNQQPINREVANALDIAITAVGAIEQIQWERDISIEQLREYGVGFGEKKKDLVEVVRCKDCIKGFQRNPNAKLNLYHCDKWKTIMRNCDFCSFGERRYNDED